MTLDFNDRLVLSISHAAPPPDEKHSGPPPLFAGGNTPPTHADRLPQL